MAALFDLVAPDYDQHVPFFTEYAQLFVPWVGVGRVQLGIDEPITSRATRQPNYAGPRQASACGFSASSRDRHPPDQVALRNLAAALGA